MLHLNDKNAQSIVRIGQRIVCSPGNLDALSKLIVNLIAGLCFRSTDSVLARLVTHSMIRPGKAGQARWVVACIK